LDTDRVWLQSSVNLGTYGTTGLRELGADFGVEAVEEFCERVGA
jgi:hypothetical protein